MTRSMFRPIAHKDVSIDDSFWSPRLEINRRVTLPREYEICRRTGRIDAFRLDWKPGRARKPHYFWDSDVAKWVEAASYSLAAHPDAALRRKLDHVVRLIASAQQPDGYLNVYFTIVEPEQRWTNLRDWHELYCAGHLIEAGVAHHEATGERALLDVVRRYADHIDATFGPAPGRRAGYPGHEEIELALVKLFRATGERRYLELSRHFILSRGRRPHFYDSEARARGSDPKDWEWDYQKNQSHAPVCAQADAVGHAVRAMYLYAGMADIAAETNDVALRTACRRLWQSVTRRKMYLTGGVGAVRRGEALGADYQLPSESAYAETCAACGLMFFAQRMLHLEPSGEYADVLEQALYNGVLSGVSRDGRKFFYENPLASAGGHHRQDWYECACCPPNLARVLASLGTYIYSASQDAILVNLFVSSRAQFAINGRTIALVQQTKYPWDGDVRMTVEASAAATFSLLVRIPGWCGKYQLRLNGKRVKSRAHKGYVKLRRRWRGGDVVELTLAMPIERIEAHPCVADTAGRIALRRGPLVYCVESCDHRGRDVRTLRLPRRSKLTSRYDLNLLGGTVTIGGEAECPSADGWHGALYRAGKTAHPERVKLRAIPCFLWDNRSPGSMAVWLRTDA